MNCDLAYIKINFLRIESNKNLETYNLSLVNLLKLLKQMKNSIDELPIIENSTII